MTYDEYINLKSKIEDDSCDAQNIVDDLFGYVEQLYSENAFITDQLFWSEKTVERLNNENYELKNRITRLRLDLEMYKIDLIKSIENNIKICNINFSYESEIKVLKKEIDGHLKYISELRNRYEDLRG